MRIGVALLTIVVLAGGMMAQAPLDRDAQRWVDATLKKLTTDQIGRADVDAAILGRLHQL